MISIVFNTKIDFMQKSILFVILPRRRASLCNQKRIAVGALTIG